MDAIATHAASMPDAPAVIEGERRLTWREFHERRARLAHAVAALGVRRGEHGGKGIAVLCSAFTCQPPVSDPESLEKQLRESLTVTVHSH